MCVTNPSQYKELVVRRTRLCVATSTLQALCGTHRSTHSMHNEEAATHCFAGAATG